MNLTHQPVHTLTVPDTFTDESTGRTYQVFPDDFADNPMAGYAPEDAAIWAYRQPPRGASLLGVQPRSNPGIHAFAFYLERYDPERALEMTRRYLATFYPSKGYQVVTKNIKGYSQSDWLDVVAVVADEAGDAGDLIETLRMWAFGDVWVVSPDEGSAMGGIYAFGPQEALEQFLANERPSPSQQPTSVPRWA